MKTRNVAIMFLLIIGIIGFCSVEFFIKPRLQHQTKQYHLAQQNALTHDFQNVVKYRNRFMGNASNDAHLNDSLPLSNIRRTYELHSNRDELIIDYKQAVRAIGEENVKTALVYDATANFALVDNLQAMIFHFPGVTYRVKRSDVKSWYGVGLSTLANGSTWKDRVQSKLADDHYVHAAFKRLFAHG